MINKSYFCTSDEDFIAVELINGTVQLQVNAGCETLVLENGSNMNDGEKHHVDIFIDGHDVVLRLDYCASATIEETEFKSHVIREDVCEVSGMIPGCGNEISTPAPLQLGGLMGEPSHYQTLGVTQTNFDGVISNVQNNGYLYDLYEPVVSEASVSGNLKTQAFCFEGENAVCRGNAKCVANMERLLYCDCAVGTFGDRCQFRYSIFQKNYRIEYAWSRKVINQPKWCKLMVRCKGVTCFCGETFVFARNVRKNSQCLLGNMCLF